MSKRVVQMTNEEVRRADEACRVAEEERRRQECDHVGDWVHDYDPESRLGDAYYCAKCGQLMQVG